MEQKNQTVLKTYRITVTADDNSEKPSYIVASASTKREALSKALMLATHTLCASCPYSDPNE